uniref:Uncharacterized protein n=1 Tax=Strigamia maritima TaxID=126957 RepID=T1IKV1_STRMM
MPSPNQATDSPQAQLTPGSPKKSQCYPSGQQGLYSPSSKMMPPQGYAQGPKRHPDFMKPNDQQFPSSNSFSSVLTPQLPLPFSGWRNDNQFAGYGSQVAPPPPAMPRDDWSGRDQSGQWSAMHQRYSSPGSSSYGSGGTMPSHINPNMSAQNSMGSSVSLRQVMMQRMPLSSFKDKQPTQYTMQTKIQPASQITATNAQYPPKRDIIFPIDSVEAITPLLVKRKKIMARDLIPVEAWRLMMSLKSGLICESTWALDMLSVLLFDDSSVLYFSLQNLPGLLEVLMEHYRRCLSEVFGMNEEIEPSFMTFKDQKLPTLDTTTTTRRHWWQCRDKVKPGANDSNEGSDVDLGVVDCVDPSDKTVVTDCYFNNGKTIHGKVVKVLSKKDLFVSDADKVWDTFEGFSRSSEHWQLGGGDTTLHIQTRFENDKHLVQFVNVLKDVKNSKSDVEESKLWSHATKDCVNSKCDTSKRTQRGESTDLIVDRCIHKDLASDDEATKKTLLQ